jgi:hypothetical protein
MSICLTSDPPCPSSTPLRRIQVGDILRIQNMDTLEAVDWMVTEPALELSHEEAKAG